MVVTTWLSVNRLTRHRNRRCVVVVTWGHPGTSVVVKVDFKPRGICVRESSMDDSVGITNSSMCYSILSAVQEAKGSVRPWKLPCVLDDGGVVVLGIS